MKVQEAAKARRTGEALDRRNGPLYQQFAAILRGQIAGGVVQGIGGVMMENVAYDAAGNPTAATFKDYLLPSAHDAPKIEFLHVVTPSNSEGGFKGVGEGGAIIGPPTMINAVADALAPFGIDCLDLPLTPARLLRLIDAAREAGRGDSTMPT